MHNHIRVCFILLFVFLIVSGCSVSANGISTFKDDSKVVAKTFHDFMSGNSQITDQQQRKIDFYMNHFKEPDNLNKLSDNDKQILGGLTQLYVDLELYKEAVKENNLENKQKYMNEYNKYEVKVFELLNQ
ncbi:hypothetical protein [Paenibacillus cremeus]|uniref:Lipoprotein n=1 Tax=Paenibacillus cremeus TaxID=2163881 RepID=A0A559KCY8_9BACL|nr:hypothetical protein [Paenibacillus cremeus]TVY09983.1 hypothetical protein FPZ49_11470 [Paenibacillus cremeus]